MTAKQMEAAVDALNLSELRELGKLIGAAPQLLALDDVEEVRDVVYVAANLDTDRIFMMKDWLEAREKKP